ncbi:long-chain fatty acid--CoA ligase [Nocardioides bigeumensis]|uniref:Long-chain fatty acid--CoA ligase n=1 Tax=Nocardioides bigeumensis TaxID=433657 RepID=A0ABP5K816_9ACTN
MLNLSVLLEDSARRYPDRVALVLGETRLTYGQVDAAANQVANLLTSRGIGRGDKVALTCPNLPYFPIVYYGILKAGAVVVPLNVLNKGRENAYFLEDSGAKAYFCFQGTPELAMGAEGKAGYDATESCEHFFLIMADPSAPASIEGETTFAEAVKDQPATYDSAVTDETDTAVILYTSGTTGRSKGAELSHSNLVMNALTCNRLFGNEPASDTHLVTLPLFHSFGSTVQMNAGFSTAATLVLLPRFDAQQAVALMQKEDITFFAGVPTMWWGLLHAIDDSVDVKKIAGNLRVGASGGSSLPVEIIKDVQDKLGVQILEGYGLSETSPVATFSDPDRPPVPGSIGIPIWGVEVKLIAAEGPGDTEWKTVEGADEIGEIAIKGHNIMKGYLNRPDANAEVLRDGWFRSGDLARRDEDGNYYIVDRSKDLIIRGGFNVYPREVEEVLMTHEAVSLAAVIGVPHESHGEEVKAVVILVEGASMTEDELVAWGKEQMAGHKYPRIVEFVDALPMTATGKILKRELK